MRKKQKNQKAKTELVHVLFFFPVIKFHMLASQKQLPPPYHSNKEKSKNDRLYPWSLPTGLDLTNGASYPI